MSWGPAAAYPVRRVLSRSTGSQRAAERDVSGRVHWRHFQTERLECGHRLQVPVRYLKAGTRRCRQCRPVAMAIKGRWHVPTIQLGRAWRFSRLSSTRWEEHHRDLLVTTTSYPLERGT